MSGTVSVDQLRQRARLHRGVRSAVVFVESEVSKVGLPYTRNATSEYTDGMITRRFLMTMAGEWDEAGLTTVDEFLDALEFDLYKSEKAQTVSEIISGLTVIAHQQRLVEADW